MAVGNNRSWDRRKDYQIANAAGEPIGWLRWQFSYDTWRWKWYPDEHADPSFPADWLRACRAVPAGDPGKGEWRAEPSKGSERSEKGTGKGKEQKGKEQKGKDSKGKSSAYAQPYQSWDSSWTRSWDRSWAWDRSWDRRGDWWDDRR